MFFEYIPIAEPLNIHHRRSRILLISELRSRNWRARERVSVSLFPDGDDIRRRYTRAFRGRCSAARCSFSSTSSHKMFSQSVPGNTTSRISRVLKRSPGGLQKAAGKPVRKMSRPCLLELSIYARIVYRPDACAASLVRRFRNRKWNLTIIKYSET